jgi:hypothetical protein
LPSTESQPSQGSGGSGLWETKGCCKYQFQSAPTTVHYLLRLTGLSGHVQPITPYDFGGTPTATALWPRDHWLVDIVIPGRLASTQSSSFGPSNAAFSLVPLPTSAHFRDEEVLWLRGEDAAGAGINPSMITRVGIMGKVSDEHYRSSDSCLTICMFVRPIGLNARSQIEVCTGFQGIRSTAVMRKPFRSIGGEKGSTLREEDSINSEGIPK